MWTPISEERLRKDIELSEQALNGAALNFWNMIKVKPEKWACPPVGDQGGGFWVVGLYGSNVVYYNDIEEGYNVSAYNKFGVIEEYYCNQSELFQFIESIVEYMQSKT